MSRRSRRAFDPLTAVVAVVAALILVAVVALQITGGAARQGGASTLTTADVQRITPEAAKRLLDEGSAALFDVRSVGEYAQAHAEGAFHYPLSEAAQLVSALPDDGAIIFY